MIFFSLITTALSSVFYGIIATLVIMAVLYIALMLVCKTVVQTPAFYVVGAVMAVLFLLLWAYHQKVLPRVEQGSAAVLSSARVSPRLRLLYVGSGNLLRLSFPENRCWQLCSLCCFSAFPRLCWSISLSSSCLILLRRVVLDLIQKR